MTFASESCQSTFPQSLLKRLSGEALRSNDLDDCADQMWIRMLGTSLYCTVISNQCFPSHLWTRSFQWWRDLTHITFVLVILEFLRCCNTVQFLNWCTFCILCVEEVRLLLLWENRFKLRAASRLSVFKAIFPPNFSGPFSYCVQKNTDQNSDCKVKLFFPSSISWVNIFGVFSDVEVARLSKSSLENEWCGFVWGWLVWSKGISTISIVIMCL